MKAGFVARAFSGHMDHLAQLIQEAVAHRGFSLIDILQPCVTFNKVNTFTWYKTRCRELPPDYDPTDWKAAIQKAEEWARPSPWNPIPEFPAAFRGKNSCLAAGLPGGSRPESKGPREILEKYL